MTTTKTLERTNDLSELVTYFTSKRGLAKLTNEADASKVAEGLAEFAVRDARARTGQIAMGHIAYEFLQLPIDQQKPLVEAIAIGMGITPPSYENAVTGRLQFAHTVYGKLPELCTLRANDRDTLAGKRISECLRLYKLSAGISGPAAQSSTDDRPPTRILKRALEVFWPATKSEKERRVLTTIFERLGVEEDKLDGWLIDSGLAEESETETAIAA